MKNYTIEKLSECFALDNDVWTFLVDSIDSANRALDNKIDFTHFDVWAYVANHHVWIVRRAGEPVGVMFAQLYGSVFDPRSKILFQDGFYVKKSSGRAANLLMKEFIDFGRANAKIIFTCRGKLTNVKARTLERLGFEKTEELFRLVVGDQ